MRSIVSPPRCVFAAVVFLLVACGGDTTTDPPTQSAPAVDAIAPPPPTAPTRDFSTLQACELVTPEEVAEIAGGTLAAKPAPMGPHCMYVVEVATGTEAYTLHIGPATLQELILNALPDVDKGKRIDGPWQVGYLMPQPFSEDSLTVIAFDHGDVAVEVSGEKRPEPTIEIAKRAFERVK